VPRLSNFLLTKRGALKSCDGSQIVNAFSGVPTAGRGRLMAAVLFQPVGVNPYYLLLAEAFDQPLGSPRHLVASDGGAGGTLPINTTAFYYVTAIDGVGGESLISNEASFANGATAHKVTLTWNIVPNAFGYNIYRGIVSNGEVLLSGAGVPVAQAAAGSTTVTYTDTGSIAQAGGLAIVAAPSGLVALSEGLPNGAIQIALQTPLAGGYTAGQQAVITGASGPFNGTWTTVGGSPGIPTSFIYVRNTVVPQGTTGGGGTISIGVAGMFPAADTTQQTALFRLPTAAGGIDYDNDDIVALFPADPRPIDGSPGGGGGGGGTPGPGNPGSPGSTVGGGFPPGNVSSVPEMVQYVNRIAIALGNGYAPQLYRDATGTPDHPAAQPPITAISVDANGVVTVTLGAPGHGLVVSQAGAGVVLAGVLNPLYNGVFQAITAPDNTHLTLYNPAAIGQAASSGGILTVTTTPLISTFSAAYPNWSASTTHLVGDIVQPAAPNGHFYKYTQAGISGAAPPTFPLASGAQVADGTAILQEAGPTQSGSPPPPGAAHLTVYGGSLWPWNTAPTNTANGLDGPTVLRMSDADNPDSWNPVNQVFIDKDDGYDGMGLASFTVTAQGIPPEGSLVVCKDFATYQVLGIFGAANFAIQRIKSDLGAIAPRTVRFIPGFGIGRLAHLGVAVFDGVEDKLISEDIRPFLFPSTDPEYADILVVDANWVGISWAAQVANPPMYVIAVPIGNSNGMLQRLLCYDLVLKSWTIVDLPFPISTLYQARTESSNPITLLGSFNDGTLQRWQAGDLQWATSASGSATPAPVSGSLTSPEIYNGFPMASQVGRLYCRQLVVRGRFIDPAASITALLNLQEEGLMPANVNQITFGVSGSFELVIAVNDKFVNARCQLLNVGACEIDSFGWQVRPETTTVPVRVT